MEINPKVVGIKIKNIRLSLGESMEKFGERFGTSKGTINNWEKGRNLPNKENLLLLSEIGKTTIEYIIYGTMNEYIDNIIHSYQSELLNGNKVPSILIPFIINQLKNTMYALASSLSNTIEADERFNKEKDIVLNSWSTPKSIEYNILTNLGKDLQHTITDTMKFFYQGSYDNDKVSKNKKITETSDNILEKLYSLEDFIDAYFDALRYLDNDDTMSTLNLLPEFTKKIDTRIKL